MTIQMISCKFCGGKSEKDYLYLSCKHLSCLSCAFLRADFSTQQIECCDMLTKIDQSSMEMIIRSKRFTRNFQQNTEPKYNYNPSPSQQITQRFKNQIILEQKPKQKLVQKPAQKSRINSIRELTIGVKSQIIQNKQNDCLDDQLQLQDLLIKNLDKLKNYFENQRLLLKERQEIAIKDIVSTFTAEKQNIQKPINQNTLQKFNKLLSNKIQSFNTKNNFNHQITTQITTKNSNTNFNEVKQAKQPNQSYDHILKRLEVNQQRMKQKIQRHLQVLY